MIIPTADPGASAAVRAIHAGNLAELRQVLGDRPELATAALGDEDEGECQGMTRTLLHVVADWPGHFPNGAAAVALLVEKGADVNARFTGPHNETPLHWAASCDDVDVLDALLDAGADIEAGGAVVGGGTAMSDATAFGQWNAAQPLLERGAETTFWEAATRGLMSRVVAVCEGGALSAVDVTEAFWGACHGGQRGVGEYLVARGADIRVGWDDLTPLDAARRSEAEDVVVSLHDEIESTVSTVNALEMGRSICRPTRPRPTPVQRSGRRLRRSRRPRPNQPRRGPDRPRASPRTFRSQMPAA